MSSTPIVSILVTVYNRERYLAACLDSILASGFQDFEVIVVDDQSKDRSVEIAEQYTARDPKIRFFRNEQNMGDYPNRLRAAQLARGKYLKYVDADDLIYRHSLAIMVEAMEGNPDAVLGLGHSQPEDERPYPWRLEPAESWRKHFLGRGCLSCGPSGAIIRRDAFFKVGGFGDWGVINDMDLWIRMAGTAPVLLLPPGLVWWRRHEGQEFSRGNAAYVYLVDGFRMIIGHLEGGQCPLPEKDTRAALRKVRQNHARRILSWVMREKNVAMAVRIFSESKLGLKGLLCGFRSYQ